MQSSSDDSSCRSQSSNLSFNTDRRNVYNRGSSHKALKQFKIIVVGESMVGKTSLIQRYFENMFHNHGTQPTLSWDFKVKSV